jgi:hypothetical protein
LNKRAVEENIYFALCIVLTIACIVLVIRSSIGLNFTKLVFGEIGQQKIEPVVTLPQKLVNPIRLGTELYQETIPTPKQIIRPDLQKGDVYQFTDSKGVVTFTDNHLSVPKDQSAKVKVHDWAKSEKVDQSAAVSKILKSNKNTSQVSIDGDQVIVPVILYNNGKYVQCSLLLDTGASHITVSYDIASRLNIDTSRIKRMTATLADGSQRIGYSSLINGASTGAKAVQNIEINVMGNERENKKYDGLLGMNFLRKFKYHIDFDKQVINWF